MAEDAYAVSRCDGAMLFLPYGVRETARKLGRGERAAAEEFRLRVGRLPAVLGPWGEKELPGEPVTKRDLEALLEIATGASAYSSAAQVREGFVTVRGGYRIGLCGSVSMRDGAVAGFSAISSADVRVSREARGAAAKPLAELCPGGKFRSALILSPPGGGKTTLLRDMVRLLSDGEAGRAGVRTALADERGEVAALCGGVPQFDVGKRTDVLDSCPKARAVMMLLRAMNPQVVALDEITAPEDAAAILSARNCGVSLLATAHADGPDDLAARPLYRELLAAGVFERAVVIGRQDGERTYSVTELGRGGMRLVGAALMLAAGLAFGLAGAARLTRHASALEAVSASLVVMESEICSRLTPMAETLALLASASPRPAALLYARASEGMAELGRKTFGEIWSSAVDGTPELLLRGDEAASLRELGLCLGKYDVREQAGAIARVRGRMEEFLRRAEAERDRGVGTRTAMGAAFGLFAAILLL